MSIKITGVKSAMSNYNSTKNNTNLHHIFYLNTTNGNVWCNIYTNCNSWDEYHDKNIIAITENEHLNPCEKLTMSRLREICLSEIDKHNSYLQYIA